MRAEISNVKEQVNVERKSREDFQKKYEESTKKAIEMQKKYDMVKPELMQAQACCDVKTKQARECNEKLSAMKEEYDMLKSNNEKFGAEKSKLTDKLKSLENSVENLQKALASKPC